MNEQQSQPQDESKKTQSPNQDEILGQALNVDDSVSGSMHLEDELNKEEGNNETEKIREELEAMKDKYLRLVAEFDNFRRRTAKERVELMQTAGKDVLQALLPVLDDTERATKQLKASDDVESIKEGVMLVFSKFQSVLQQQGLKRMESVGQTFDAELHEAITEVPVNEEEKKGKIIDEIEPGYYLNNKIIRHAKVVVGK